VQANPSAPLDAVRMLAAVVRDHGVAALAQPPDEDDNENGNGNETKPRDVLEADAARRVLRWALGTPVAAVRPYFYKKLGFH
jgi:hypothetical protein